MPIFLATWGGLAVALIFLTACGYGPALALRPMLRFAAPASALLGVAAITLGTLFGYYALRWPLLTAGIAAGIAALAVSLLLIWENRAEIALREIAWTLAGLAVAAAGFAWFSGAAAILLGEPALLYVDGTDHIGYANYAGWMADHLATERAAADPLVDYPNLPEILTRVDTRFGAFALLGLASAVTGLPPVFAYDGLCAVLLVAGIAGVAAAFARTVAGFALIAAALFLSNWFELSHAGFLGKLGAFPMTLLLVGLLLSREGGFTPLRLLLITVIAMASALLLAAWATVAVTGLFVGTMIAVRTFFERTLDRDRLAALLLTGLSAFAGGGFLASPRMGFPVARGGTSILNLLSTTDIFGIFTRVHIVFGYVALLLSAAGVAYLLLQAFRARDSVSVSLLFWPFILPGIFFITLRGNLLLQFGGILFPAAVAGAVALLPERLALRRANSVLPLLVFLILLRAPHGVAAYLRYTSPSLIAASGYGEAEMATIADAAAGRPLLVDLGRDVHAINVVMVELGRRGVAMQWTPEDFHVLNGGWHPEWTPPVYPAPAPLRLIARDAPGARSAASVTPHFAIVPNNG
ncbi:MAG TPA: hypothetical protein VFB16_00260 [Bauldia sp.]|nr:hypothetical protein [Bauldia sp.]